MAEAINVAVLMILGFLVISYASVMGGQPRNVCLSLVGSEGFTSGWGIMSKQAGQLH